MIKRSVWATSKARKVKPTLVKNYGQIPVSDKLKQTILVMNDPSKLTRQQLVDFLADHNNHLKTVLKDSQLVDSSKARKLDKSVTKFLFSVMPTRLEEVQELSRAVASRASREGLISYHDKLKSNSKKYLQERGFKFDRIVFEFAFSELLRSHNSLEKIVQRNPDLKVLERAYVKATKAKRHQTIRFNTEANRVIRASLAGMHASPQKIKVAKRWLEREHPKYIGEFNKKLLQIAESMQEKIREKNLRGRQVKVLVVDAELEKELSLFSEELLRREKEDLRNFISSTINGSSKQYGAKKQTLIIVKNGSREQRLKDHQLIQDQLQRRGDIEEAQSSSRKLEQAKVMASVTGAKFDQLSYSLAQISKTNSRLSEQLNEMVKKRALSAGAVAKLYSRGSLTQRAFFRAINEFGFVQKVGQDKIEDLAKMLTVIGPQTPRINTVLGSVKTGNREQIFNFLKQTRLINDQHRDGKCVAIVRAKS